MPAPDADRWQREGHGDGRQGGQMGGSGASERRWGLHEGAGMGRRGWADLTKFMLKDDWQTSKQYDDNSWGALNRSQALC